MSNNYSKSIKEVLKECDTSFNGLKSDEVLNRQINGKNEIAEKGSTSILSMIFGQLKDKMIIILIIAAVVSYVLGESFEAIVIAVIIVINVIISVVQEKKAEDAILALKKMNAPFATVLRDGRKSNILVSEIVVGDIVYLDAGGIVPADIRLIEENRLMLDESMLTGESLPVEKSATKLVCEGTAVGDRVNMVYSSTIITYGYGFGVVVAIGMDTEVGHIAKLLNNEEDVESPLRAKLNIVGQVLSLVGIFISILIFVIGLLYGRDLVTILMISISLAISVIPEGLPATATIVMALGVQRMAKKNALVKKLPSVETLGSASVICTDKTGTLTQNKMTVVKALSFSDIKANSDIKYSKDLKDNFVYVSMLCNNATFTSGDPTEIALLNFAKSLKYKVNNIVRESPKLFEQPFDSERKMMSTVNEVDEKLYTYTKGAIESIVNVCTHIYDGNKRRKITSDDINIILNKCDELSSGALRILGFASKELKSVPKEDSNVEKGMTFLGIVGMIDPPRVEVFSAIKSCQSAGIKVIMITGDHKLTAVAIGKSLGIYHEGDDVMTGVELENCSFDELKERVKNISIFARVSPEDKLNIVNALKANNEIVAMTGDGVNDSPALKVADMGVAMGMSGSDVAKSAADMLLLDDNFITIEAAIKEGRRVYYNIQKVVQFLLAGNIAEVMVIFIAIACNLNTPILAIHILFVNLLTDTLPALALGVDPASANVMKHKPVKKGTLFETGLVERVIGYGLFIAMLSFVAYLIGIRESYGTAVTMTFLVLCLSQIVHALNQHSNYISVFSKDHPRNKYLYGAMGLSAFMLLPIIFVPFISNLFNVVELSVIQWIMVFCLSIMPLIVVEIIKFIKRSLNFV